MAEQGLNEIDLMDEEELSAIVIDENDNITQPEPENQEDEAGKEGEKPAEQEPETEEKPGTESDSEGESQKTAAPEGENESKNKDEEPTGPEKALKDTQRAFHEKAKRVKELEEENRNLKQAQIQKELDAFQPLTDYEQDELRRTDPDAYIQYKEDEKAHEELEETVKTEEEGLEAAQVEEANKQLFNNVLEFGKKAFGIDTNDPKAVEEFIASEDFQKVDAEVSNTMKRIDGVYTVAQMEKAWNIINLDKIKASERQAAREETINSINKARPNSKLDSLPKDGSGAGNGRKELSELTTADWDRMDEDEVAYYSKLQKQEDGF